MELIRIKWVVDCRRPVRHDHIYERLHDDVWEAAAVVLWLHCPVPVGQSYQKSGLSVTIAKFSWWKLIHALNNELEEDLLKQRQVRSMPGQQEI